MSFVLVAEKRERERERFEIKCVLRGLSLRRMGS